MSVWMIETMLATTLLMAVVMMLRRPVARWVGAGAAYWLWALPVARMLLPTIPVEVAAPSPLHSAIDQAGLPALVMPADAVVEAAAAPFPWLEMAVGLWLVGLVAFMAVQAIGYIRFRRLILKGATLIGEEGRLRIVASPRARGPLAFGILHPHIVLPVDFDARFDPLEREMALAHERAHHAHGDLAANMVALLLLGIHWCNPVAWIAYRAFRADQEQACDARVLALYGQDSAPIYGRAILKAAGGRPFAAACHLTRITALKGRLKMLSSHEVSLRRISWGMAAVGVLTLTGLMLTASGSRAARQVAAMTANMPEMRLSRLTDLVVQDASATTDPVAVPETPLPPAAIAPTAPAIAPVAPTAPAAPVRAEAMPPLPPVPPIAPRIQRNRIVVAHSDGRQFTHTIPSEAEIRRMVPDIDVSEGCDNGKASHRETVDANGRRHVRIRICEIEIERSARAAERAGQAAERHARLAEIDAARVEREAQRGALQGLLTARESIARNGSMPADVRADVLRELDSEIADMRAGRD